MEAQAYLIHGRSTTRVGSVEDTGSSLPGHEDRIGSFFNGSLQCDNVEATHRQLSQRGVEFVEGPTRQPWGTYAKFKDPDGNTFVLSSG